MPRFCTKPAIVEAFQFTYDPFAHHADPNLSWPAWFCMAFSKPSSEVGSVYRHPNGYFVLRTHEGLQEISQDDYVVQDAEGNLSCCAPDVFEQIYNQFHDGYSVAFEYYSPLPGCVATQHVERDASGTLMYYCSDESVELPTRAYPTANKPLY